MATPKHVSLSVLALLIVGLGLTAAAAGLVLPSDGGPFAATSVRGEATELYGRGIYHLDSRFAGAGARGTDVVTLVFGLPLLLITLFLQHRGSLRGRLLLPGALAWFLYVYASFALGSVVYNGFFLVYVALFSASLFALRLALREAHGVLRASGALARLPRRGPATLLLTSGCVTLIVWLVPLLTALATGRPPERLDIYTGRVTDALDLGIITPATILTGLLVLRGKAAGFAAAVPLFTLEALLLPMIAAQTVSQIEAGVTFTGPELIGPIGGFVVLAAFSLWALVAILRQIPNPDTFHDTPAKRQMLSSLT